MTKQHFYILKIKRNILPFSFLLFTISLLLFSKNNLPAVKQGLNLWVTAIVPSLFPFFVATELLMHTNIIAHLGKLLNKYMNPLFHVKGEGSFAFLMGIISGYPVGAKIACEFRKKNICSKEECERLLSFTNNSGPLFIIGTVGITMFGNSTIGFLLLLTHLLSSLTVGFLFRFWKYKTKEKTNLQKYESKKINEITLSNLGGIIGNSITNSINTILLIGGFVVLFSVILNIIKTSNLLNILCNFINPIFNLLNIPTSFSSGFISGIIELTNGLNIICTLPEKKISINIILASFLLGLGGISVLLQVWSVISKTDLSIKPYIIGKILHACFSAFYTFLFLKDFIIFNFDL